MSSPYSLSLNLSFGVPEKAAGVLRAITPELGWKHERRARTSIKVNKNILSLEIKADDLTALKASVNTYMKLIALSDSLIA